MCSVSIIVPVFNSNKSLKRCLDSIRMQTFKDFEVWLINDGSTDNSLEICELYCEIDDRFNVITQQNSGPSSARNRGIENATGKYIYFIDSDDTIELNAIEILYNTAINSEADITICGHSWIRDNKKKNRIISYPTGVYEGKQCFNLSINMLDVSHLESIPPFSCLRLIRRDLLNDPDLRYSESLKRSEDYLFVSEVHFRAKIICLITNQYLYNYIDNDESITNNHVENYWVMIKHIYNTLIKKLPDTTEVYKELDKMLIYRSRVALSNACRASNKKDYKNEISAIINDKDLINAVDSMSIQEGLHNYGKYYLLMRLKLKPIIKLLYNEKYHKIQES